MSVLLFLSGSSVTKTAAGENPLTRWALALLRAKSFIFVYYSLGKHQKKMPTKKF
jgi:hypothetical protein